MENNHEQSSLSNSNDHFLLIPEMLEVENRIQVITPIANHTQESEEFFDEKGNENSSEAQTPFIMKQDFQLLKAEATKEVPLIEMATDGLSFEEELDDQLELWETLGASEYELRTIEKKFRVKKLEEEFERSGTTVDNLLSAIEVIHEQIGKYNLEFDVGRSASKSLVTLKGVGTFNPNKLLLEKLNRSLVFVDAKGEYKQAACFDILYNELEYQDLSKILSVFPGDKEKYNFLQSRVMVCNFEFDPSHKSLIIPNRNKTYSLNTYVPADWCRDAFYKCKSVEPIDAIPEIYQKFSRHLLANHEESYRAMWLRIAFSLKGRVPNFLGIVGPKGTGKTTLANILSMLHGKHNSILMGPEFFSGRFNSEIANCTFAYLDEVFIDRDSPKEMSKLKLLINDTISVEPKYQTPRKITNHATIYMSGNDPRGLPVEDDNRRFTILRCTDKRLDLDEINVDELLDSKNIELLAKALIGLNVSIDQVRSPYVDPETLKLIVSAGQWEWEKWATDWLLEYQEQNVFKVFQELQSVSEHRLQFVNFREAFNEEFPDWAAKKALPSRERMTKLVARIPELLCQVKRQPQDRKIGESGEKGKAYDYFHWSRSDAPLQEKKKDVPEFPSSPAKNLSRIMDELSSLQPDSSLSSLEVFSSCESGTGESSFKGEQ